jgi:hypothetical protein
MSTDPTQALLLALASGNNDAASRALSGFIDPDDPIAPFLTQLMNAQLRDDEPGRSGVSLESPRVQPEFPIEELEQLRQRNDQLAAALGACYLCWGDDVDCPVCGGTGVPAAARPDSRYFALYVLPVLNRLRRRPERFLGPVQEPVLEQGR